MKILIVEDDNFLLDLYKLVFEQEGFTIVTAEDGAAGFAKSQESEYDLILLDIMMPKLTGFEVLDKIKASEKTKKTPVFMLTNIADQKDVIIAREKGALNYIIKSQFLPKQIVEIIREFFNSQKK